MEMITEKARDIPVAGRADVIVVGGGLAGIGAAACARRNGASVILLEKSCVPGGLATAGHVCVYMPLDDGLGHKIYGGFAEELLHVCHRYGYDTVPDCWKSGPDKVINPTGRYQTTFNIPACVLALDEFLSDEGVEVIFDTAFCTPVMDGKTCRGVIVENKSGRSAYMAKMIIDASGDADVFYRAGASCEEQKNIVSHWTYELDVKSIREGSSPDVLHNMKMRWFGLRPDRDNSGSSIPMYYGTSAEGVNGYLRKSRSLALDYLKNNQREGYAMMTLPMMPQFRMTRRIIGKAEMELVPFKSVDSSVGCVMHCLEHPEEIYEFPYEALIDSEISNMAAAGRIVSAGGRAWEIMRFIPACVMTGQVSGTAAAMAIEKGCSLQDLPVSELQKKLADSGVMIHMSDEIRNNKAPGKTMGINDGGESLIKTDSLSYDH